MWCLHHYNELDPIILSVGEQDEVSIADVATMICEAMNFTGKLIVCAFHAVATVLTPMLVLCCDVLYVYCFILFHVHSLIHPKLMVSSRKLQAIRSCLGFILISSLPPLNRQFRLQLTGL